MFLDVLVENMSLNCRSYGFDRGILRFFLTFLAPVRVSCSGRPDNPYTPQRIIRTTAKDYQDDRKQIFGRPKGDIRAQKFQTLRPIICCFTTDLSD